MKLLLHKMQGCGNDFLFLDFVETGPPEIYPSEIVYLCDRHFGIGADGLVILGPSATGEAHASWQFYNSDGSTAEMCGNAARCAIKYLSERRFPDEEPISLETAAGIIKGRKIPGNQVEITIMKTDNKAIDNTEKILHFEKHVFTVHLVNTGVPHAVLEVKDLMSYPINRVGRLIQNHPVFEPEKVNVTFYQKVVGNKILSTTFERGVEKETLACGTGATAAAVIYSQHYLQPLPITVQVPGGDLTVDISPVSRVLLLQGPAEYVMSVELQEVVQNFERPRLYSERTLK